MKATVAWGSNRPTLYALTAAEEGDKRWWTATGKILMLLFTSDFCLRYGWHRCSALPLSPGVSMMFLDHGAPGFPVAPSCQLSVGKSRALAANSTNPNWIPYELKFNWEMLTTRSAGLFRATRTLVERLQIKCWQIASPHSLTEIN